MLKLLHDTTSAYKQVKYDGIEYAPCKDYTFISRYRRLRQVIHYTENQSKRFVTNEVQNAYDYNNIRVTYFEVTKELENRLDLVSYKFYNSTSYSWILAYLNEIPDGFTIHAGQLLTIPTSITELFSSGCILASVPPTSLNLGTE